MESEKVKEIKKGAMWGDVLNKIGYYKKRFKYTKEINVLIRLINELESENERLSKELTDEWKERRKAEEDLHKAEWNYKIGLGQSRKRNKELKDRIAELEKERGIKLPETKKEIISEMGVVIKEFTRQNADADTVDGFVEVNKFIKGYISNYK